MRGSSHCTFRIACFLTTRTRWSPEGTPCASPTSRGSSSDGSTPCTTTPAMPGDAAWEAWCQVAFPQCPASLELGLGGLLHDHGQWTGACCAWTCPQTHKARPLPAASAAQPQADGITGGCGPPLRADAVLERCPQRGSCVIQFLINCLFQV